MIILDPYYWEDFLDKAAKNDDRLHDAWMELIGDDEYQTLLEFFDPGNYPHDDEDDYVEVNTHKELTRILRGKDRIALIRYAFILGQLVGRACKALEDD